MLKACQLFLTPQRTLDGTIYSTKLYRSIGKSKPNGKSLSQIIFGETAKAEQ